jgi:hypothetical protein
VVPQRRPAHVAPRAQLTAAAHAYDLAGPQPGLHQLGVGVYHLHIGAPRVDVVEAASISGQRLGQVAFSLVQGVQHPDADDSTGEHQRPGLVDAITMSGGSAPYVVKTSGAQQHR